MKAIEILEMALLIFALIVAIIINSTIGMLTVVVICILAVVVMSIGIDPFDVWPSLNGGKFIPGRLIQHRDGRLTLWMDGQNRGNVFVSNDSVLYAQKALDSAVEEAKVESAKGGLLVGAVFATLVIGAGFGLYKLARRDKHGKV